jgi:hypothetical protein
MGRRSGESDKSDWRGEEKALWRGYKRRDVENVGLLSFSSAWGCGLGTRHVRLLGPAQIGNDVLIACQPLGESERQRMGTAGLVKRDGAGQDADLMWLS